MQLKLTSLILLCCTPSQAFNNIGTCERTGPDGSTTKFCCDFFEKTSNGCIACTGGFESFNGTPCVPCKQNTYGKKCWNWCSCLTSQRCDHINGCVEVLTTIELYQDVSKDENVYEYVYAFGGAVVFGMVLLGFYYKIKCYSSQNIIISQDPETNHTSEVNEIENVYDEIDELALDDVDQQPNSYSSSIEDDSSNSSGTTKSDTSNNEGYLNPYQPIIQHTDTHTYSLTSAAVSSNDEEMCNQAYVNVKQDDNFKKSSNDSDSQSLDYSDIPIDMKPVTVNLDRYENTRIF